MMPLFLASAISDSIPASFHAVLPAGILALVEAAVRALLVAGMVGAGLRLLAARHVPAQKAAWGLVLAGALLMPFLAPWAGRATWLPSGATLVVPARTWSQMLLSSVRKLMAGNASTETPHAVAAASATATIDTGNAAAVPVQRMDVAGPPSSAGPIASHADRFPAPAISYGRIGGGDAPRGSGTKYYLPLSDLIWMIYGAVSLALLLRLSYGLGGAIGLWQSAEPVYLDSHLGDGLRLRSSRKISSPVTIGSAIVLPADYDEWDTAKLRIVLAHERSHVGQGDFYLQALAGLYAAIFWFSPLGWWLRRKLSDLSETISDHAGLEEAADHVSYARILLEFAALPRQTQVGVAMAHSGRITQRIERLLNENSFRQAFTGGRRRVWAALVLVPAVLFATAALIRVQAAQTLQVAAQGPVIGQSHPEAPPDTHPATPAGPAPAAVPSPAVPQAPPPEDADEDQAPAPPATPAVNPSPAAAPQASPTPGSPATPAVAPAPASPNEGDETETTTTQTRCNAGKSTVESSRSFSHMSRGRGYAYAYSSNGESYAVVSGNGNDHVNFSGDWYDGRRAQFDKARAIAHGDFLWFTHDGKSYVVDDPKTIASIEAMYKPMEDLGRKQEELGRQQRELGDQQRELGRHMREASVPSPDVAREMAELKAAVARLEATQNKNVTMERLAELQAKIGEMQGKLGGLQGEIGARQGELGRQQGLLGDKQGKLGEEQGRLGAEQGRMAHEADTKVKSIIDQALKDGRAKQVQ